jgi:hypothetical protein
MPKKNYGLTLLGKKVTRSSGKLEVFPNKYPKRDYQVVGVTGHGGDKGRGRDHGGREQRGSENILNKAGENRHR